MALSGLQIQKLLPKTNCKECGASTCLAFAMKLAAKKADLSECPYASEEAKQVLGADSEPPVKKLTLGEKAKAELGGETVLYRHEKTFVNQPVFAVNIDDNAADMDATLAAVSDYILERVGETLTVGALALTQKSDAGTFAAAAKKACDKTGLPVVLRSADMDALTKAAAALNGTGGVISGVTADRVDACRALAEENALLLSLTAPDLDGVYNLAAKLREDGFTNYLIEFGAGSMARAFQANSIARIAALKDSVKALGHPTLSFVETGSMMGDTARASLEVCKYGGIIVLPSFDPAQLVALMTLRLNIFTDPQKPIQVEPKVYPIGEPGRDSPVFVTTNFSLTYFLVSGEIENAGISAWLVIPDTEGFSVLTAWAAGKFSGAHIAKFIKDQGLEEMVDTRTITIPGYVSQISGELEEGLPGWKVSVGPQEAGDLESYIKSVLK